MSTFKEAELNTSERLAALAILNTYKGNLDTLAVILEDIRQFVITDEDWVKADRKVTAGPDGDQWVWDNEKGGMKKVSLAKETTEFILKDIDERDKKGEFTIKDKPYIDLRIKLK